jgi:hypothetical protein
MILRAIFWIGLVAVLMPHEPDLGLGRPVAPGAALISGMSAALKQGQSCAGAQVAEVACAAAGGLLDRIKASGLERLAEVKTEIATDERAREASPSDR